MLITDLLLQSLVRVLGRLNVEPVEGYEKHKCWVLNTVAAIKVAIRVVLFRNDSALIVSFIENDVCINYGVFNKNDSLIGTGVGADCRHCKYIEEH